MSLESRALSTAVCMTDRELWREVCEVGREKLHIRQSLMAGKGPGEASAAVVKGMCLLQPLNRWLDILLGEMAEREHERRGRR